jgi:hypothetical protein
MNRNLFEPNNLILTAKCLSENFFKRTATLFPGNELVSPSRITRQASRHTLRNERLIRVSSGKPNLVERGRKSQLCVTSKFLCFINLEQHERAKSGEYEGSILFTNSA